MQKKFFCQGVVVQEALSVEGAGCKKNFFARGRECRRHYQGVGVNKVRRGQGAKPFLRFDTFFLFQI